MMFLEYIFTALLFLWLTQMVAVISIATMEGGFNVGLTRRNLVGVILFSAFISTIILTLMFK